MSMRKQEKCWCKDLDQLGTHKSECAPTIYVFYVPFGITVTAKYTLPSLWNDPWPRLLHKCYSSGRRPIVWKARKM